MNQFTVLQMKNALKRYDLKERKIQDFNEYFASLTKIEKEQDLKELLSYTWHHVKELYQFPDEYEYKKPKEYKKLEKIIKEYKNFKTTVYVILPEELATFIIKN